MIAGADKGHRGKVLKIDRKKNKVVVEGAGRVWKHVRRSQKNPQGGRLNKEMPISVSNVMLVDPSTRQTDPGRCSVPGRRQQGTIRQEERCQPGQDRSAASPTRQAEMSSVPRNCKHRTNCSALLNACETQNTRSNHGRNQTTTASPIRGDHPQGAGRKAWLQESSPDSADRKDHVEHGCRTVPSATRRFWTWPSMR